MIHQQWRIKLKSLILFLFKDFIVSILSSFAQGTYMHSSFVAHLGAVAAIRVRILESCQTLYGKSSKNPARITGPWQQKEYKKHSCI